MPVAEEVTKIYRPNTARIPTVTASSIVILVNRLLPKYRNLVYVPED